MPKGSETQSDLPPKEEEKEGTIYLLHFSGELNPNGSPRNRAKHYVGWYRDPSRLNYHANGTSGVAIVNAFLARGYGFEVARQRPGTKADERRIKNAGGQARYCPLCTRNPRDGVWATTPTTA